VSVGAQRATRGRPRNTRTRPKLAQLNYIIDGDHPTTPVLRIEHYATLAYSITSFDHILELLDHELLFDRVGTTRYRVVPLPHLVEPPPVEDGRPLLVRQALAERRLDVVPDFPRPFDALLPSLSVATAALP
jgi:hypothetical protein